jgi:hypothetical protein
VGGDLRQVGRCVPHAVYVVSGPRIHPVRILLTVRLRPDALVLPEGPCSQTLGQLVVFEPSIEEVRERP